MADATSWTPQSPGPSTLHSADEEPIHPQHRGYRGSISHSLPYSPPIAQPTQLPASDPMPRGVRHEESMDDADYVPEHDAPVMSTTEKVRGKAKSDDHDAAAAPGAPEHGVNITVHFPVARIKRIMQADDDVGKVAQVTPVVVSKALELFMISLVTKSAAEAKARNSKRVGAIHLKQAVANEPQFDFLTDIVAKVADAPPVEKSEDAMDVDGKKKKPVSRRRRKNDDDDF